jgi:hypothetical protein
MGLIPHLDQMMHSGQITVKVIVTDKEECIAFEA